ncbi:MAG TPA: hypothetical protein ENJ53_11310, partial [Phaeodactylibacter sp.]|nr:hypothetical protein [Phaeodactylibacter sp.]
MNIPHLKYHLVFVLSFLLALTHQAQTILYAEDFNGCELPSDWTVNVVGGGTPVWNVGMPDNTNSDGTTIDGTCMLIIDDDAAGDGTEGYKVQFTTPTFDATQFSTIELSMDVHFRNYETSSLKIFVFDGNEFQEIKKYDSYEDATGQQFSEFETYVTDLSFYANQNMSIMIQYDDADYFAWWAGVDNIEVVGTGTATNVVLETFNDCVLPLGWTAEIVQGDDAWQFGYVTNPNAWDGNSMNGNCFAFFDDDVIGDSAAYSVVRLFSPVFDGTAFATFTLDYDLVFRRAVEGENLTIYVFDGQEFHFVKTYTEDTGGPQFTAPVDEVIDLSAYRSENMQIVFQYEDGDGYGWWVGIDNVKVSGEGLINDLCENAFALQTGVTCLEGNNLTALFTGDEPSCGGKNVGSLWYTYQADFTGIAKIETRATFNELITIYEGGCAAATELHCYNRDEHGFTGEIFYVNITSGNEYLIRVSGLDEVFGVPRGSLCIDLQEVANFPNTPTNDDCVNAVPLTVGGACVDGNNYNANFSGPEPSRNNRSRADIWYSFLATTTDELLIESNADFADVITLFSGACGNLTEVAINDHGQELKVEGLTMGEIYFIQISGYFATVEGNICVAINANSGTPPANDDCANPILVNVDGGCVAANNAFASLDGPTPSCEIYPQSDIWYQFTAPANGSVKFNTGGGFPHTISVYHGGCNDLEEVFCAHNPLACDGFVLVNNLLPNETYLVQISSSQSTFGYTQGDLCLEILNGNSTADTPPLSLSVDVNCLGLGSGELNVFIAGGTGNYTVQGNAGGDTLATGETYLVIVTDDAGCERSVTG